MHCSLLTTTTTVLFQFSDGGLLFVSSRPRNVLLEEKNIPYLFVPSKQDLGAAACTKRPTSVVLIKDKSNPKVKDTKEFDGKELYDTLIKEAKEYNPVNDN